MKILYLIPARGGSKGLPGKNIKILNGKPLIYYTIDAAREVGHDVNICISTDDEEIANAVEEYGLNVPFKRPTEIATDTATSEQVISHALNFYESQGRNYDYVVLLQPTSPLRTGKHLAEALEQITDDTEMIVSVKETGANPYYVLYEENPEGLLEKSKIGKFSRRQDCPIVYETNGAIYIISVAKYKHKGITNLKRRKFVMDKISSVDIDDLVDFKFAEFILISSGEENKAVV